MTSKSAKGLLLLDDTSWSGLDSGAQIEDWEIWDGKLHDLDDGTEKQPPTDQVSDKEAGAKTNDASTA